MLDILKSHQVSILATGIIVLILQIDSGSESLWPCLTCEKMADFIAKWRCFNIGIAN